MSQPVETYLWFQGACIRSLKFCELYMASSCISDQIGIWISMDLGFQCLVNLLVTAHLPPFESWFCGVTAPVLSFWRGPLPSASAVHEEIYFIWNKIWLYLRFSPWTLQYMTLVSVVHFSQHFWKCGICGFFKYRFDYVGAGRHFLINRLVSNVTA